MKKFFYSLMHITVIVVGVLSLGQMIAPEVFSFGLPDIFAATLSIPIINTADDRDGMVFRWLQSKFPNFQIEESYVRGEVYIQDNISTYTFNPRSNYIKNIDELPLQRGCDDNDVHVVVRSLVALDQRVRDTPTKAVLQTYPNALAFSDVADPTELEVIYNGELLFKVSSQIVTERISLQKYRRATRTQQSSATNFSDNGWDEMFKNNTPYFVISGKADSTFTVNLQAPAGWAAEPASAENGVVLTWFFQTYRIINAGDLFYYMLFAVTGAKGKPIEKMSDSLLNKQLALLAMGVGFAEIQQMDEEQLDKFLSTNNG